MGSLMVISNALASATPAAPESVLSHEELVNPSIIGQHDAMRFAYFGVQERARPLDQYHGMAEEAERPIFSTLKQKTRL